jgi:hypothetical protein
MQPGACVIEPEELGDGIAGRLEARAQVVTVEGRHLVRADEGHPGADVGLTQRREDFERVGRPLHVIEGGEGGFTLGGDALGADPVVLAVVLASQQDDVDAGGQGRVCHRSSRVVKLSKARCRRRLRRASSTASQAATSPRAPPMAMAPRAAMRPRLIGATDVEALAAST